VIADEKEMRIERSSRHENSAPCKASIMSGVDAIIVALSQPPSPEAIAAQLKNVPGDLARDNLYPYAAEGWNRESIAGRIAFAAETLKAPGLNTDVRPVSLPAAQ
jgi:hypothetical protein